MFISKLMLSQTAWTPVWLPWLLWCSLKTSEYGGSAFLEFGQNLILTVSSRCRVGGCLKRFSVNGAPDVFCEGKVGRMRVRPGWRLAALRLQFCMVLLKHSFCPQNPQLSISCVLLPRPHTARDAGLKLWLLCRSIYCCRQPNHASRKHHGPTETDVGACPWHTQIPWVSLQKTRFLTLRNIVLTHYFTDWTACVWNVLSIISQNSNSTWMFCRLSICSQMMDFSATCWFLKPGHVDTANTQNSVPVLERYCFSTIKSWRHHRITLLLFLNCFSCRSS